MSSSHILVPVDDFGEDDGPVFPYQARQAAGHEVHAICPVTEPADTSKAVHGVRGTEIENGAAVTVRAT